MGVPGSTTRGFGERIRRAVWPHDRRLWGFYAVATVFVAHAIRYATFQIRDAHVWSDGHYSWLYARSLAFDFDIHLVNDYAMCGDPFHLGVEEGGGRPANPFYFGPAVYLAPILFILRHVVKFGEGASASWRAGCTGPIVAYGGVAAIFASALTVWISYRVARRYYGELECSLGVLVVGLASPLNVFGTLTWYYSHLWAALSVAIALLCTVRAHEEPESRARWLGAGLACGLAALMRPQEALWMLVPLASIVTHAQRAGRGQSVLWRASERCGLVGVGFLAVFWIQLFVYYRIYGSPWVLPQGKLYVQLSHAHPWLLLFGARCGMLYWTPLLWLGVLGVPWLVRNRQLGFVGAAIVVTAILNFYVSSAVLSWTGGATLGARIQTSLAAPLLLLIAASIGALSRWALRRRAAAGTAVALALAPWIWLTWVLGPSGVPNDRPVAAPQLYGAAMTHGMADIYESVGNPWTLPATLVFAARYGAHPRIFDQLATDGMWQKHYRNLSLVSSDTFSFVTPPTYYWSEGFIKPDASTLALPANRRARFLITLYWPWVTSVRITGRPLAGPVNLTIDSGSFWTRRRVGTVHFNGKETVELAALNGAFDSGINEVILTSDAPLALETWQWLDSSPHDTRVHLFEKTK